MEGEGSTPSPFNALLTALLRAYLNKQCTSDTKMHGSYLDMVHALAARALASNGRQTGLASCKWNLAGNCQAPVSRTVWGRPSQTNTKKWISVVPGKSKNPYWVDLEVRCRKCDPCRAMRRRLWSARAKAETMAAVRTWFGTLTLSMDNHTLMLARARQKEALQGVDFDALPYGEQFLCRHRAISDELTRYLKRLRKHAAKPLRNLVVAEAHKSGLPHYHALIHETHPDGPIRHAALQGEWKLGFSRWNLVTDPAQATYLCKYLSKSTVARVRASVRYGNHVLEHSFFAPKKRENVDPPTSVPRNELSISERLCRGEWLDCFPSQLPFFPPDPEPCGPRTFSAAEMGEEKTCRSDIQATEDTGPEKSREPE